MTTVRTIANNESVVAAPLVIPSLLDTVLRSLINNGESVLLEKAIKVAYELGITEDVQEKIRKEITTTWKKLQCDNLQNLADKDFSRNIENICNLFCSVSPLEKALKDINPVISGISGNISNEIFIYLYRCLKQPRISPTQLPLLLDVLFHYDQMRESFTDYYMEKTIHSPFLLPLRNYNQLIKPLKKLITIAEQQDVIPDLTAEEKLILKENINSVTNIFIAHALRRNDEIGYDALCRVITTLTKQQEMADQQLDEIFSTGKDTASYKKLCQSTQQMYARLTKANIPISPLPSLTTTENNWVYTVVHSLFSVSNPAPHLPVPVVKSFYSQLKEYVNKAYCAAESGSADVERYFLEYYFNSLGHIREPLPTTFAAAGLNYTDLTVYKRAHFVAIMTILLANNHFELAGKIGNEMKMKLESDESRREFFIELTKKVYDKIQKKIIKQNSNIDDCFALMRELIAIDKVLKNLVPMIIHAYIDVVWPIPDFFGFYRDTLSRYISQDNSAAMQNFKLVAAACGYFNFPPYKNLGNAIRKLVTNTLSKSEFVSVQNYEIEVLHKNIDQVTEIYIAYAQTMLPKARAAEVLSYALSPADSFVNQLFRVTVWVGQSPLEKITAARDALLQIAEEKSNQIDIDPARLAENDNFEIFSELAVLQDFIKEISPELAKDSILAKALVMVLLIGLGDNATFFTEKELNSLINHADQVTNIYIAYAKDKLGKEAAEEMLLRAIKPENNYFCDYFKSIFHQPVWIGKSHLDKLKEAWKAIQSPPLSMQPAGQPTLLQGFSNYFSSLFARQNSLQTNSRVQSSPDHSSWRNANNPSFCNFTNDG